MEDLYQVGFAFLYLILASFSEDASGAQSARAILQGKTVGILDLWESLNVEPGTGIPNQLSSREIQALFENACGSDFKAFREQISLLKGYSDAFILLEKDAGAGWKLIFRMLARGQLIDPDSKSKIKVTCNTLIRDGFDLFKDIQ